MAFRMTTTTAHGIPVSNAYIRIAHLGGIRGGVSGFQIRVEYYNDYDAAHEDNPRAFKSTSFDMPYDEAEGDNVVKRAYDHLKTLPEFTNVTDA